MIRTLATAFLLFATFAIVATACKQADDDEDPTPTPTALIGTPTPERVIEPDELTADEILAAAIQSGLNDDGSIGVERGDAGVLVEIIGSGTIEVGQKELFVIRVMNDFRSSSPEKSYRARQDRGELLTSGPITVEPSDADDMEMLEGEFVLEPDDREGVASHRKGAILYVTCTSVGNATISFHSEGTSEIESPVISYRVTTEFPINCVEDDGQGVNIARIPELNERFLGFAPDSLNWVVFGKDSVNLYVNQVDPIVVNVGDSAEVYAYFEAWDTLQLENKDDRLRDARLEMTGGGPIVIDSPPGRQSDLLEINLGDEFVVWGARSATVTCVEEGDGVYTSNFTGFLLHSRIDSSEIINLTVSGLIDCVPVVEGPPIFSAVYTMEGRPYLRTQFRVEEPHDGCVFTHVHSDVTVFPFREWFFRGTTDNLQTTGDALLTDPEPEKCGFGPMLNVSGSRITPPVTVLIPINEMMDFCGRSEIDQIRPTSERETINLASLLELCSERGAN